ncbi:MAG: ATP-binding protein, partial [Desulfobulbaceae bacterium]|nr:ATP-binding protein [Desulfobulbaceae bacterium]
KIDPETGSIKYTTIDNSPPMGICGSGIIDLVAGLYLSRMIDIRGKFRPNRMGDRLIRDKESPAFVVAPAEETVNNTPVIISQIDLDALIRSKAAMYSILTTLINQVSMKFEDLENIFVAGAFGRHIDPRQAVVLGMLPDLPLQTYVPIGNSSLKGARKILLDASTWDRCHKIAKKITYIELNVNQEFMIRFSGSRFIPHTDHTLFPSVPFFSED